MPSLVQIGGKRSSARPRRPDGEAFLPTNLAEALLSAGAAEVFAGRPRQVDAERIASEVRERVGEAIRDEVGERIRERITDAVRSAMAH